MTLFGGSGGFASMLVKQYYDAPPGSATRTKMLEAITKLTVQTSEMAASGNLPEVVRSDQDVQSDSGSGGDAPMHV